MKLILATLYGIVQGYAKNCEMIKTDDFVRKTKPSCSWGTEKGDLYIKCLEFLVVISYIT